MKKLSAVLVLSLLLSRGVAGESLQSDLDIIAAIDQLSEGDSTIVSPKDAIEACSRVIACPSTRKEVIEKSRYIRAVRYCDTGNLEKAWPDIKELLLVEDHPAKYDVLEIRLLLEEKNYDLAENKLGLLLKHHPKESRGYAMAAFVGLVRRDPDAAIKHASQAIALDEKNATPYYTRAVAYAMKLEWKAVLLDCSTYLTLTTEEPVEYSCGHLLRGTALLKLNRPEEAIVSLTAASKANPDSIQPLRGLLNCYSRLGKHNAAILTAKKILEKQPTNFTVHEMLSCSLFEVDRFDESYLVMKKALLLHPDDIEAYVRMEILFIMAKDFQSAEKSLKEGYARDAKNVRLVQEMAQFYAACPDKNIRDGKKALGFLKEAQDLDPTPSLNSLVVSSIVYAENGEFDKALTLCEKARAFSSEASANDQEHMKELRRLFENKTPFRFAQTSGGDSRKPKTP